MGGRPKIYIVAGKPWLHPAFGSHQKTKRIPHWRDFVTATNFDLKLQGLDWWPAQRSLKLLAGPHRFGWVLSFYPQKIGGYDKPPKWMVKIMEILIKIDDLGGPPLFLETPRLADFFFAFFCKHESWGKRKRQNPLVFFGFFLDVEGFSFLPYLQNSTQTQAFIVIPRGLSLILLEFGSRGVLLEGGKRYKLLKSWRRYPLAAPSNWRTRVPTSHIQVGPFNGSISITENKRSNQWWYCYGVFLGVFCNSWFFLEATCLDEAL